MGRSRRRGDDRDTVGVPVENEYTTSQSPEPWTGRETDLVGKVYNSVGNVSVDEVMVETGRR